MQTIKNTSFALSLVLLSTATFFAQDEANFPNQVNGAVTKTEPGLLDTPFLWISIVVFALALVLLFLKKGQTATGGRKTNVNGRRSA